MAPKRYSRHKYLAKLATGKKGPCAFCHSIVDDEINYGKIYVIGDITCHYFCVLLSSCLIQHGKDDEGLFGFLYEDILAEVERSKKHKCSFCQRMGANLGCSVIQCKKQFHLPCGKARDAVSLFYGNYKSFCISHAPKQKIPDTIMAKARLRKKADQNMNGKDLNFKDLKELSNNSDIDSSTQSVCVICYEYILGYPTVNSFWPPCCARDAWFHRSCLQRMALSAGMHFLKCPLCNDKDRFYEAVVDQGYYVPDRDAAWELEQNAFAEIYERQVACAASECLCPLGREHDADTGAWCIKLCILCGSSGVHNDCESECVVYICVICQPAAPADIDKLTTSIEAVISQEQAASQLASRRGPVMPSRMSLRRTKPNPLPIPSTSSQIKTEPTETSREELNLKPPRKPLRNPSETLPIPTRDILLSPSKWAYSSPTKLIEEGFKMKGRDVKLDPGLMEDLRTKFRKPKPLCEKKKLVNDILSGMFDNLLLENLKREDDTKWSSSKASQIERDVLQDLPTTETSSLKQESTCFEDKESLQENITISPKLLDLSLENTASILNSPKKLKPIHIQQDLSLEISENDKTINVDMVKIDNVENYDTKQEFNDITTEFRKSNPSMLQYGPNPEIFTDKKLDFDVETFKNQYLNEIVRQTKRSILQNCENKIEKPKKKSKRLKSNIILKFDSKNRKLKRKKISIKNKHLKVKIQWKKQELKLKISDSKKKKSCSKLKQYILDYNKDCSSILNKPKNDVTPVKRKYIKNEKSPDNLVQTNIHKFFKVTTPNKD